jgi:hypothetical protein
MELTGIVILIATKIDGFVTLDRKYPNNGHGLVNQLFSLINYMVENPNQISPPNKSYIDFFSIDPVEGDIVNISQILNLEKMNSIWNFQFLDIVDYKECDPLWFKTRGILYVYEERFSEFQEAAKKLIFSDKILEVGRKLIKNKGIQDTQVNVAHLRFCSNLFQDIDKLSLSEGCPFDFSQTDHIYLETSNSCREAIYKNCDPKLPLVLLVPNKNHPFVEEISRDYNVVIPQISDYKELVEERMWGRDIWGLCDISFSHQLNINNLIIQDKSSTYSKFLSIYLDYKNKIDY